MASKGIVAIIIVTFLGSCQRQAEVEPPKDELGNLERKVPFIAIAIAPGMALQCKSDQVASGGFWRTPSGSTEEGGKLGKESNTTTWRISIKGKTADVVRFAGATQSLDEPEVFDLEDTGGGLLLTSRRGSGESPQIITIDLASSSFVYSSQYVSPFSNRANVFYGSCRASP